MSKIETEDKNEWMNNVMNRLYNLWSMEEIMATGHTIEHVMKVDPDNIYYQSYMTDTATVNGTTLCSLAETEVHDTEYDLTLDHADYQETNYEGNIEHSNSSIILREGRESLSIVLEEGILDEDWSSIWSLSNVKPFTDSEGITLTKKSQGFVYDCDLDVFYEAITWGTEYCMKIAKGLRRNELQAMKALKSSYDDADRKHEIDDFLATIDGEEVSKRLVPAGFDIRKALHGRMFLENTIHVDEWKADIDIAA